MRWLLALSCLICSSGWASELTFSTWRQEDRAAYTELFAEFTRENPGITVRFEAFPNEQYQTILSTALAGGKGADVIHTRAYGGLEQLARAGYLLPLDDPGARAEGVRAGRAIGAQSAGGQARLFRAVRLADARGAREPRTPQARGRGAAPRLGRVPRRVQGTQRQGNPTSRERHQQPVHDRGDDEHAH